MISTITFYSLLYLISGTIVVTFAILRSDAEFFRKTPNLTLLFRKIASCPATLMDKKNLKITFTKLMGAVSEEYWDMVFREQRTPCWCQTL